MGLTTISPGDAFYLQACQLRYNLFFQPHDLPYDVLFDDIESQSLHMGFVKYENLVAYGRLTKLSPTSVQISQMVVDSHYQRQGLGSLILDELMSAARVEPTSDIFLHARLHSIKFYHKHGFNVDSETFFSRTTGVPHVVMRYHA